ncbi:glycosyltransferase family 2 protein [uncultured Gulosibacter sp.]|uniref:glycosyltransferase family 2 protein n=1 Tax=uncultured Gulosibacter sp. TaxID=1339167 RepID=UPI00288BD277|nr:glycosyltransferase family 2 protein [uncultured Gulosibacter sp.]
MSDQTPADIRVVMTLMVRDEADIISTWLEYHLSQDIDQIIVTDNASVDGTREILEGYASRGLIDLRHYPHHDKKQYQVVTAMARDAYTQYSADWVLNSDADEFWVVPESDSLGSVVRSLPRSGESFPIPVSNMVGRILETGIDLANTTLRDVRSQEQLELVGLHSHPTHNLIHPGRDDIEVAQGNHFSSAPQADQLPDGIAIEVLHVPWRSWQQYRDRVTMTGRAYESSPDLKPSPRHHTMRDYRWLKADFLKPFFVARLSPSLNGDGFAADSRLADICRRITASDGPESSPDETQEIANQDDLLEKYLAAGPALVHLENDRAAALTEAQESFNELAKHNQLQHERIANLESSLETERDRRRERELLLDQKVVELLDENAHLRNQLPPAFLQRTINFARRMKRHK